MHQITSTLKKLHLPLLAFTGVLLSTLGIKAHAESPPPEQPPVMCEYPSTDSYYPEEGEGDWYQGYECNQNDTATVVNSVNNAIRNVTRPQLNQFIQPVRTLTLPTWSQTGTAPRMLKSPGACTPKPNSLSCDGEGQNAGGADVSGRVRGGVIGEVGRGRAVTSGQGGAQRQETCTPEPGKLTCAP